jgi:Ca-activated chloride channel family protein
MGHKQTGTPAYSAAGRSPDTGHWAKEFALQPTVRLRAGGCYRFGVPAVLLLVSLLFVAACAPAVTQHNNAGNELFATGTYDDALAEYRQAQVNDPDVAEPYYNAANALNRQGMLEGVQAQTSQALKTADPDLAVKAWYNLGNAFFDAEDWEQAIAAYREALRIDPDDQDAKRNLELALEKQREEQQQTQQEQQDQDGGEGKQSSQPETSPETAATPTPQGEEGAEADEPSEQPAQGTPDASQGTHALTPEQARQMLEALVGDSETLQERLQKVFVAPGRPPERDW